MNKINLQYIDVLLKIEFEKPLLFFTYPTIVFRSILGCRLRRLCCIAPRNKCFDCQFNKTCAYATIFETIISKDTDFLAGRNRGSHPFRLKINPSIDYTQEICQLDLTVQLYGFAIQYLPYIVFALQQAGKDGLFKTKSIYNIKDVVVNGVSSLKEDGNLNTDFVANTWTCDLTNLSKIKIKKHIHLVSPLRFKVQGKYSTDFSAQDFLYCIERRLITLCSLYGIYDIDYEYNPSENITIKNRFLKWLDYDYNSHRQDEKIQLGGAIGDFMLIGEFNTYDYNLLKFANIFGAGKNTSFGYGDIVI